MSLEQELGWPPLFDGTTVNLTFDDAGLPTGTALVARLKDATAAAIGAPAGVE